MIWGRGEFRALRAELEEVMDRALRAIGDFQRATGWDGADDAGELSDEARGAVEFLDTRQDSAGRRRVSRSLDADLASKLNAALADAFSDSRESGEPGSNAYEPSAGGADDDLPWFPIPAPPPPPQAAAPPPPPVKSAANVNPASGTKPPKLKPPKLKPPKLKPPKLKPAPSSASFPGAPAAAKWPPPSSPDDGDADDGSTIALPS